jgi:hypothetical protein
MANSPATSPISIPPTFFPRIAAKTPFPKSPINVRIAGRKPTTLSTFVNPIFPLPDKRGSMLAIVFPNSIPKGMDPKRYETASV